MLGPDEGNPLQYTGRENDGTELYYYRARYYDPVLKRFISQDSSGLEGGNSFFGCAGQNPIQFTDPSGLKPYLESTRFRGHFSMLALKVHDAPQSS